MEELLTVKECSKILKTNTDYVYRLINSGKLKCLIVGSKKVRRTTLDNFIRDCEGMDAEIWAACVGICRYT